MFLDKTSSTQFLSHIAQGCNCTLDVHRPGNKGCWIILKMKGKSRQNRFTAMVTLPWFSKQFEGERQEFSGVLRPKP
jgi:hypothetical protein